MYKKWNMSLEHHIVGVAIFFVNVCYARKFKSPVGYILPYLQYNVSLLFLREVVVDGRSNGQRFFWGAGAGGGGVAIKISISLPSTWTF